MQSRRFKSVKILVAAAALLIVCSTGGPARCQAAENWEEHVFITPVPIVAERDDQQSHVRTNPFESLTRLAVLIGDPVPHKVFPLSWYESTGESAPDSYEQAPVILKIVYGHTDSTIIEWHIVWYLAGNGPRRWHGPSARSRQFDWTKVTTEYRIIPSEWSPMKLAGLVAADRAVPEQVVPYVTINDDRNWFRFRFVYPTKSQQESSTENRSVKFDLAQFDYKEDSTWLDGLRIYRLFVPKTWGESGPRIIVVTNMTEGYDVIEVDATKMSYDIEPIGDVPLDDRPQSRFDKWLGEEPINKAAARNGFYFGITR